MEDTFVPLKRARQVKHAIFLATLDLRLLADLWRARVSREGRKTRSRVIQNRILPALPKVNGVWAIAMVRDEFDVIEETIRHLVDQEIDHILLMDNGSIDGTRELVMDLQTELPLSVGIDNLAAYEQGHKMTALAEVAHAHGAKWIVPFDADELWFGPTSTVGQVLRTARRPIQRALLWNCFPDSMSAGWKLDYLVHPDPKVAFRTFPGATLGTGNHTVQRPGRYSNGLRILHRPWRSFAQFERKIRQGAAALSASGLPRDEGYHWRQLDALTDDDLKVAWELLLKGRPEVNMAWTPKGELVSMAEIPKRWSEITHLFTD